MADIQPYQFPQLIDAQTNVTTGFEELSALFSDQLKQTLDENFAAKVEVISTGTKKYIFMDWLSKLPQFASYSVFSHDKLDSLVIVRLDPAMIARLIDICYGGGNASITKTVRNKFQTAELRLIKKVASQIISTILSAIWLEPISEPQLKQHETSRLYLNLHRPEENILCQSMQVSISGQAESWTIEIIYTDATMRGIVGHSKQQIEAVGQTVDHYWQRDLCDNLMDVHLPLRAVMGQPVLSLPEVLSLRPGDFIPFALRPTLPLYVANKRISYGQLGEQSGGSAYRIEQLCSGDPQ